MIADNPFVQAVVTRDWNGVSAGAIFRDICAMAGVAVAHADEGPTLGQFVASYERASHALQKLELAAAGVVIIHAQYLIDKPETLTFAASFRSEALAIVAPEPEPAPAAKPARKRTSKKA